MRTALRVLATLTLLLVSLLAAWAALLSAEVDRHSVGGSAAVPLVGGAVLALLAALRLARPLLARLLGLGSPGTQRGPATRR